MRRLLLAAALLSATATATAGCVGDGRSTGPVAVKEDTGVYVAVGASETVGEGATEPLTEAWPQVFYRSALPRGYTFVNLGISGATVQKAIAEELPEALRQKPAVVTVWLNVNDLLAQVSASTYEKQLRTLVHGLRRDGKTRVLVANTPPLDVLPRVQAFGSIVNAFVTPYNEAIARVVKDEGAELVDLYAAGKAAQASGAASTYVASDGFHPSTAGHAAVAAAFAAAWTKAR
jgi:lysophospholipase L1-like esterase